MAIKDRPVEILEKLVLDAFLCPKQPELQKPGELIIRLNQRDREVLQELKSDDIKSIRFLR